MASVNPNEILGQSADAALESGASKPKGAAARQVKALMKEHGLTSDDIGARSGANQRIAPRKKAETVTSVNPLLSVEKRPMYGQDLLAFRSRHNLRVEDVIYALAFATMASFTKTANLRLLPYDREVLMRLYDRMPGPTPWKRVTPRDAFFLFYEDLLKQFDEKSPSFAPARTMLFARFTAMLGRTVFRGYSWIEGHGKTDGVVAKILTKACSFPDPRDALESAARTTWALRGVDFDAEYPLPDPKNPPMPKPRGKRPKANPEHLRSKREQKR
jgi:hypothetical protein